MERMLARARRQLVVLALALLPAAPGHAVIPGIQGPSFSLRAGATYIPTPDGDSLRIWAFGAAAAGTPLQYPGPTLIVEQGATVTITLTNNLPEPTSIVFPGQGAVTTSGGAPGLLTAEAAPSGGTVTYSFVARQPGTYLYQSGSHPELQIEMGLVGALIVRPTGFDANVPAQRTAYGHPDTAYDHEYLFLLSEMDPRIHDLVDFGHANLVDNPSAFPVLWFINGRNGIDTLSPAGAPWLPAQPYDALARTRPGEKVLLRFVGAGRDPHPFHPHGNHSRLVARDARLLGTGPGTGADLAVDDFTFTILPGATYDAIFTWTGRKLGWDIYGDPSDPAFAHDCTDAVDNQTGAATPDDLDDATAEYCPDHGKPLRVTLPGFQDVAFGGWWSGSAFLGHFGNLPPGEGGLNLNGGLFFMWHSHNEKELTNNDIFPGGMLTFVIIEPPGTAIP
ncbi:MAG: hypothetical protein DCC71_19560 [Proteobacteria bacterium]|nr:MAG: hypothetical protein DCC71_19560 [Pseudomonadota bacterium]